MQAIISRIMAVFMTLVSLLLPAQPNNVEVRVKDMTTASVSISYTCINNTGRRMSRPDIKTLEKKVDGEWQEIKISYARTEIAYHVNPGIACSESAVLEEFDENGNIIYNYLEAGEYRLTVYYRIFGIKDKWQDGESSTLFTVTQA